MSLPQVGSVIGGRYRLDRRLGEGGMGTVWAATHTVTLCQVALKLLRPEARSQHERFLREARAAASVEHPHVVRVQDVFPAEDGTPTMVMELLAGESYQARLDRQGRLSVAETAAIVLPVVSAVGAAHAAGIVHRDLKPDNIFLATLPDGTTHVKVLDFGIAKLTVVDSLARRDLPGITRTGALLGTPFYMSPEQAVGEGVDHRSDIWSLGIVLYQSLTGVLPTRADTLGGVLRMVMTGNLPPLSQQGVELPPEVVALVDRMLAHDAELRVSDLHEVQAILSRYASVSVPTFGDPVAVITSSPGLSSSSTLHMGDTMLDPSASGGSTTGALTRTPPESVHIPKRSSAPLMVGGLLLALGAGGGVAWRVGLIGAKEPTAVEAETDSAPELEEPKLGLQVMQQYRDPDDDKAGTQRDPSWWEGASQDFGEAAEQPGAPERWRAAHHFTSAMANHRRGDHEAALKAVDEAILIAPKWAELHAGRADVLVDLKRYDEALDASRTAQRFDPKWWVAVATMARAQAGKAQLDEAIATYQRALTLAPNKPRLLAELALSCHANHLDGEAVRYADRALAINPNMVSVRMMLAERAVEAGRDPDEAVKQSERAVTLAPKSPNARLLYGDALLLAGRRQHAEAAYDRALELVDTHGDGGVPEARLQEVKAAWAAGRLPALRGKAMPSTHGSGTYRSNPEGRTRPNPTRPKPSPPDRSRPAPKPSPPDRSRPGGIPDVF